jgi:very-short-patch-repair endonuclease
MESAEVAVIDDESADQVIAAIATRQHGIVSRAQLRSAGLDRHSIDRRIRGGRLHPVHRGVYAVGHRAMAGGSREIAALLACGRRAVVSHRSAAALLQLLPYPANPGPVDVTVVGRQVTRRRGIRAHRAGSLQRRDVRKVDGIRVTSAARTLLDLATVLPPSLLERAIAEGQVRGIARKRDLVDQLDRNPGRRGTRVLRRLLEVDGGPALTRSEAERRLLKLIRAAELPMPEVNARVGGHEVDFLWPRHKLAVEVDGFAFHSSRASFERDRQRDSSLAAHGYTVIRVTWRQLVDAPAAVVARIAASLAARG